MIKKSLALCVAAALFALCLAGCAANEDAGSEEAAVTMADVTTDDMNSAYYLMATAMPETTSMNAIYITGSTDGNTVRATFGTIAENGEQADVAAEAEDLLKIYSQKCAEAALARVQEDGDEQAIEAWQAVVDQETANEDGQGGLFDTYKLIVSIKNDDGTLEVDGEREAGADSAWNWQ